MTSVGETLRRERLRKALGLEQISRETKISARLLDAIENDQFDALPGGVFAKSFVRQYARFLGLDEEELAADLEKVIHPVEELPGFAAPPAEPAFKVPRMVEWEGTGRSKSSVLPALAMVVAVMLVCSAVFAWWQRSRHSAPAKAQAVVQKAPSSLPAPIESAPATSTAASNPQTAPQSEASTPQAATPTQEGTAPVNDSASATLRVSLTADADSWVQISADGKNVMTGVLHPQEVKTIAAVDVLRIRTGNAGDLQVSVNGKPAGPLGPKGQVRTLEVTRGGLQILPPPPKPAPAPALEPL